jgi:predicted subunit of tRNA(5-methylaminomethyl-2-thiouridylate) methyltransferase
MQDNKAKEVLVLFSGGRDSSSVAVLLAMAGYKVKMYTYQAGLSELTGLRGDSMRKELLRVVCI